MNCFKNYLAIYKNLYTASNLSTFFLQKQILQGPLAILPWDWAEASVVTALLVFGQDVLEDVFRKFAPSSLEGYSLTGSSGTGILCCLSFMNILNILTGTVL